MRNTNSPTNISDEINKIVKNNTISFEFNSSVWAMLKLNKIIYKENNENKELNLAAISFSNGKIIIININTMKIHQELIAPNTPYSLTQFKDDPNYLISSISNGQLIIYILKENKYEQFQVLEKPTNLKKGGFNKVIALSDGNLLSSDRGSLSIWKPKIEEGIKDLFCPFLKCKAKINIKDLQKFISSEHYKRLCLLNQSTKNQMLHSARFPQL